MAQQTAVDWLIKEIDSQYPNINILWKQRIIEQAKQMEEEQHGNTWIDSRIERNGDDYIGKDKTFEEYYKETYGTE
jgi:hypothetical protein